MKSIENASEKMAIELFGMDLEKAIQKNLERGFSVKENKVFSGWIQQANLEAEIKIKISYKNLFVCALLVLSNDAFKKEDEKHLQLIENFFNDMLVNSQEANQSLKYLLAFAEELGFKAISVGLSVLYDFSYRCPQLAHFNRVLEVCQNFQKSVLDSKSGDSKKSEKELSALISFADFGRMRHFQMVKRDLETFIKLPIRLPDNFFKWIAGLEMINAVYEAIDSKFNNELDRGNFQTGKLAFDSIAKRSQLVGEDLTLLDQANQFLFVYGHTAFLNYYEGANKLTRTHINPDFKMDPLDMVRYLQADYFDINILALIDPVWHPKLKSLLGKDWQEAIRSIYQAIEITVYHRSGDWPTQAHRELAKQVKQVLAPGLFGKVPLTQEAKKMSQPDYRPAGTMLCSEFVARRILVAIHEFNAKMADMSEGAINPLAKFPFGEKLDLTSVSPSSLLQQLKKSGCLEQTDLSAQIAEWGLKP